MHLHMNGYPAQWAGWGLVPLRKSWWHDRRRRLNLHAPLALAEVKEVEKEMSKRQTTLSLCRQIVYNTALRWRGGFFPLHRLFGALDCKRGTRKRHQLFAIPLYKNCNHLTQNICYFNDYGSNRFRCPYHPTSIIHPINGSLLSPTTQSEWDDTEMITSLDLSGHWTIDSAPIYIIRLHQ